MPQGVRRKWRPPLWFVLAGPLAAVFVLPLLGVGYFRLAGGVLGWRETSVMIGGMALLTALILAYLLWRLVLLPVRRMTDHARAVAKGQTADPITHFGTPEFSDLGHSVMDMGRVLQGRRSSAASSSALPTGRTVNSAAVNVRIRRGMEGSYSNATGRSWVGWQKHFLCL